jgi:hypothetical protein
MHCIKSHFTREDQKLSARFFILYPVHIAYNGVFLYLLSQLQFLCKRCNFCTVSDFFVPLWR